MITHWSNNYPIAAHVAVHIAIVPIVRREEDAARAGWVVR